MSAQPITAVRRIQFCAGHRVWRHESKCNNLHGHNYVAFFHAEAEAGLDGIGRVIDFSVLKAKLGGWVDANWDHGFIHHAEDTETIQALAAVKGQKTFALPTNPTAENMADYLLRVVGPQVLAGTGVTLTKVVLWETENCYVEVSL
jgi:6-pyruvoyltetrahydropterin/6-carboxytetrahydropterin synthase